MTALRFIAINYTNYSMKRLNSLLVLVPLLLVSLFVLDSCATSRKSTNNATVNAPNYKQIKKAIGSKDSDFYYPELLRRFESADTTLTTEQIYYFYYGTATQSSYNPYNVSNYKEVKEALSGETFTENDWRKAAQVVEKQLESDPTNLRFHVYKQIAYSNLYGKESKESKDAYMQVMMLFSAITSTGDGKSPETAYHVISTTDEYGLMDMLGLSLKSQSLIERHGRSYDLMEFEENNFGLKSLYFDVTVCMEALNKVFGF